MQQTLGKPWRAMILKDNDGDVGIALASWEGAVAGKPGVKGVPGIQRQIKWQDRNVNTFLPRSEQGTDWSGGDSGSERGPGAL